MGTTYALPVIGRNYELSAIVDVEDYRTLKLWEYRWYRVIGTSGITYAQTNINGKMITLHRLIMGTTDRPRSVCVDHIDRNGLNCSRTNMRITDNTGNQRNARKHLSANPTSSYKGVRHMGPKYRTKPWRAEITLSDSQPQHIGTYRTQEDAAKAYNKAAIKLFGPMARLNVIRPKST